MQRRNLRATILALLEEHHLLTARQILSLLEEKGTTYNKTSVYRTLDQLLADTELCRHFLTGNEAEYELRSHHHAHLVCNQCGSVAESECMMPDIPEVADFEVDHHHVTLIGTCGKCRAT
jgi:Fe2+ or Zn2+ uptake regulation protein